MSALPSQKYDFVLESFIRYLIENKTAVGYKMESVNDYWMRDFLRALDKGEWEL